MDFYERIPGTPGQDEILRSTLDSRQVQIWTAQPGIVTKVSDLAGKITVDVQPAIKGKTRAPNGMTQVVAIGAIPDVPVVFPRGGNYVATFPIAVGDEVLIVHGARNIDGWWQNGGVQPPLDSRLHDITDAFAIPGPFSQATKFANLSTTTAQLRTLDGTLYAEIDAPNKKVNLVSNAISLSLDSNNNDVVCTGAQNVNVVASSQVTITAPLTKINGPLQVTGAITGGEGGGDQVGLMTHTHQSSGNDSHGDAIPPTLPPTAGT
jgi:phage baseplate assembly protein gpV